MFGNGFAVIIVNGDGIQLILPNREAITYSKKDILNTTLDYIYKEHKLNEYPICITGNLCIGRGISICLKNYSMRKGKF